MALLIKNARVFAPEDMGVADLLVTGREIAAVGKDLVVNLPGLSLIHI